MVKYVKQLILLTLSKRDALPMCQVIIQSMFMIMIDQVCYTDTPAFHDVIKASSGKSIARYATYIK